MKILKRNFRRVKGSTLVLAVVVTGVIGFLLASYLTLVRSENVATVRSQAWNVSVPIVEAGVEDALTHLNKHGTEATLASQGWQKVGNLYCVRRYLGPNYYEVVITNWFAGSNNLAPVVESRGFVVAPTHLASTGVTPIYATAGANSTPQYVIRGVRVNARQAPLFPKGMVAKGGISLGSGTFIDSFDSADSTKSTNGKWDVNKRQANGSIASNSSTPGALNIGSADVYGSVSSGPGGTPSISSGAVGDKAWVDGTSVGIQSGHYTDDMNVQFPDVVVPFSGGFAPSSGTVNGVSYDYVLTSLNYSSASLVSLTGNKKIIVTGNAQWHLTAGIKLAGNASITVASNASVKLYVGGDADLSGNGVMNQTGNAANFFLFGKTNCTSIKIAGNGTFYGVIYAPNADMTLNGGGSGNEDVSGATITKSVNFNGHFKFHYDENLARLGMGKGFVVTSWNEMTPQQVATRPTF